MAALAVALAVLALATVVGCANAGAHIPANRRSFPTLHPADAATQLRQCIDRYSHLMNRTETVGKARHWAGYMLDDQDRAPGVVAGPLIPKAMTSSLRKYYGNVNRPVGLDTVGTTMARDPDRRNLWFAVVRDPLTRFVDAYVEAGNGQKSFHLPKTGGREKGEEELCVFSGVGHHDASAFCAQSPECRRQHFINWVVDHNLDNNGRIHRIHQMYFLEPAADRLDVVLRLETLREDFLQALHLAKAGPESNNFTNATEATMMDILSTLPARTRTKSTHLGGAASIDACETWRSTSKYPKRPTAFFQVLQDNALQWSTPDVLRLVCRYLALDYACLRYAMPSECQVLLRKGEEAGGEDRRELEALRGDGDDNDFGRRLADGMGADR